MALIVTDALKFRESENDQFRRLSLSANFNTPVPVSQGGTGATTEAGARGNIGLGDVANERQYSAENPPPYPVTSVNGQTGAVAVKAFSNLAYTQAQDISALTSLNGTFTAPDYGFIFGELVKDNDSADSQYELKIGNKIVVHYRAGASNVSYSSFCIPIVKGGTIIVSRCTNMYFPESLYLPKFIAI